MKFAALIVAAGEGKRLGSSLPKAFVSLQSKPLYRHSLEVFQKHPAISEIVLVIPSGDTILNSELSIVSPKIVAGGAHRQDSVWNGLQALSGDCEGVLIHDAARPFLTLTLIDRLIQRLKNKQNAVPAIEVSDTLKSVEGDRILKTVDRSLFMRAQTPQACLVDDLKRAFQKAKKDGWIATDEAGLLERAEILVFIVEGDPLNIKITTQDDLKLAESILGMKK